MRFIFLVLLTVSAVFCQDLQRVAINEVIFQMGIEPGSYNSSGFSNIAAAPVSRVSGANPASLANFSAPAAGIDFAWRTNIDYYFGSTRNRAWQWLPASFGFVYPMRIVNIGVGYRQRYSMYEKYELSQTNSDGKQFTIESVSKTMVHSPSLMASLSFDGLLFRKDRLSLGAALSRDFWIQRESVDITEGKLNAGQFGWKAGALYAPNGAIELGILYEKGVDITGTFETEPQLLIPQEGFNAEPMKLHLKLPGVLAVGISAAAPERLRLSLTLSSVFWNSVNDLYQDQLDFSFSSVYSFAPTLDFSLGIFRTDLNYRTSTYYYTAMAQNATFLSAGVRRQFSRLDVRLEAWDSHLFTAKYREQTGFRAGVNFHFR
ncbi:MAG: hypothetical protein P8184_13210 [Calditrichia bacterium]